MKFREFTINNHSTREFVDSSLDKNDIDEIKGTIDQINNTIGREKGFTFILMKNGGIVYKEMEKSGGYLGLMIKSPHYIGLHIDKIDHEIEFFGAFHMQAIINKLYEMNIGSCWITIHNITTIKKLELIGDQPGTIQYLLAFGRAQKKKPNKHQAIINRMTKYDQDPYGIATIKTEDEHERLSVVDTVYLNEWGNPAPFAEMESRGVLDLLYYVRNAPSYENIQPCRLILKNGYVELAIINPENEGNYTDAGIMMYMLHGLARELGFPSKWYYVRDESNNKEYRLVAHFDL